MSILISEKISPHIILSMQGRIQKLEQKNNLALDSLKRISALETGGSKGEIVREAKIALTKIGKI